MKKIGDIDIDIADRQRLLGYLNYTNASSIRNGAIEAHTSGVYVQDIPKDPLTGLSSIDYEQAEQLGYVKIDLLSMNAYEGIRNEEHLLELMNAPVDWSLLEHDEIIGQLYHIHDHASIVKQMKPRSVEQLAMVLAMIRPGKRHMVGRSWSEISKSIWIPPVDGGYFFKKSHAISYALMIIVQLNFLIEKLSK